MKIYLAIAYSGYEEESFKVVNAVAGALMQKGHVVYSPISQNHPIAKAVNLPTSWEFWEELDSAFIEWCEALVVVDFKDYKLSTGVQAEMKYARELNKLIFIIPKCD